MTARKGEPWGTPAVCPADLAVVSTDRGVRDWVIRYRTRGEPVADLGVAGGDLARTCGGATGARPAAAKVTVDAIRITIDDGEPTWGVAHVVVRQHWLTGEVVMAMNAQFYGQYDIAPRSHPNDGKLDIVRVDRTMGWRERLQARQRARTGTHLPHGKLSSRSLPEVDLDFDTSMSVWVDGVRCGAGRRVRIAAEPDALTIYV